MTIYHQTGQFHLPSTRPSYAPSLPLEPTHGTLNIHPDIDAHRLQASIEWTLVSHVNTPKKSLWRCWFKRSIQSTSADITTNYDGHNSQFAGVNPSPKVILSLYRLITKSMHHCLLLFCDWHLKCQTVESGWRHSETARARYCSLYWSLQCSYSWDIFITHHKDPQPFLQANCRTNHCGRQHSPQSLETGKLCPVYLLCDCRWIWM